MRVLKFTIAVFLNSRLNNLLQEIGNNAEPGAKTLIFVETKKKVENITRNIRRYGWSAVCMHGDKSQQERDHVMREFRNGKCSILVATDVAARGLGKYYYRVIEFVLVRFLLHVCVCWQLIFISFWSLNWNVYIK